MRIPSATYRLQFNPGFTFRDAEAVIEYLYEFGISDVYASPVFKARKGSMHGYDVVDPNSLNPELGGEEAFERLSEAVRGKGMGWIQDFVPNHMAFNHENKALMDVLENGTYSRYYGYFNIEWEHPHDDLRGRVLAPFLGRFYGDALEDGEIRLAYGEHGIDVSYYDLVFPLNIETYADVLDHRLNRLKRKLGREHPDFIKFLGVLYVLKTLPSGDDMEERYHQIAFVKGMVWELYRTNPDIRDFIDGNIATFNGEKGTPESFDLLDNLLSRQLFRLSLWKVASEELNYRRFFSINDLISVRVEDETVFSRMHGLVMGMLSAGRISGLRIDHIDGLYNPGKYLERLRQKAGDIYIAVEKILDRGEELPESWPVEGTTGYDFLNYLNGIFIRIEHERKFSGIYERFGGFAGSYDELVVDKKRLIIGKHMAGDVDNLAHLLKSITGHHRHGRDITQYGLRRAIVEVMAQFPVYRSYLTDDSLGERDREYIIEAVSRARRANPSLMYELDFIEHFLLLESADRLADEDRERWIHFGRKFQQFTGPLMAKGFEDTVLYIYNRLISQNDVGGNPKQFGTSIQDFHSFNERRRLSRPHSMNATATHDTKRGEDTRARLNALSEFPEEWEACLKRWSRMNRRAKRRNGESEIPDRNDEYFFYQTLIGTFPSGPGGEAAFPNRIKEYMIKAVREAKIHTAWLKPDSEYEDGFSGFIDAVLAEGADNEFPGDFRQFHRKIAFHGIFNSLSQTLCKLTLPGVPDVYQGTELWDYSLVDPDNRRPVDYPLRARLLRKLRKSAEKNRKALVAELLRTAEDGRVKLYLMSMALECRRRMKDVFTGGGYVPLRTEGAWRNNIFAFARTSGGRWAVTCVPRFTADLARPGVLPLGADIWKDTAVMVPGSGVTRWLNVFTGDSLPAGASIAAGELFNSFPAALLQSE